MSTHDDNDFHLEVTEEGVCVGINESFHSDSVISTKWLGPCIGFIWSFNWDGKPQSILDHYSYPDDEAKSKVEEIMISLLNRFLSLLEEYFQARSLFDEDNECRIDNLYLLATGGDYIDGSSYRKACVALCSNEIRLDQFTNDREIHFIYRKLKNRIITLNPVVKCLSFKSTNKAQEKKKLPIDFPSIWVNFSCTLKVASFRIRFRSPTRCFSIAYANIHLEPTQTNQTQWQIDTKRVEIFKTLARPAEIKRLEKAIKLISKDGILHISTDCSSIKKVDDDDDDKKEDEDYDSEDDVSEDENDDYDDADHDENYWDNNDENYEPLDD